MNENQENAFGQQPFDSNGKPALDEEAHTLDDAVLSQASGGWPKWPEKIRIVVCPHCKFRCKGNRYGPTHCPQCATKLPLF